VRLPFHRSLRIRLLFASVLIEAIMLSVLVGNSVRLIHEHLVRQAEVRVHAIELAYKTALAAPLASRDYLTLRDILQGWKSAEDVRYLAVTDNQGQILAAVDWNRQVPLPAATPIATDQDVIHIVFPVEYQGVAYGRAHYGLSSNFIRDARDTLFRQSVTIALLELTLTFLLLFATGYWLTRDFAALADASRRIGAGDLDVQLPLHGSDEVTAVSASFNSMAAAVKERLGQLAESEQRFRAIADYTYAWENWFGADGRLRWVNPAVERMTGYSVRDCMTMDDFPLPLVHPADRDLLRRSHKQALAGHTGQDLEFRVLTRDARQIWMAMAWQPIHAADGSSLGYRASLRDITLQHRANEELAFAAAHDALTGLHNRRAFERELKAELAGTLASGGSVAVFYIDLDQFKLINDTCGHTAGDALLQHLARVMESRFSFGFLARLGGDEFGMILSGVDVEEAERRAQHIIDDIRAMSFTWEGRSFRIGASIGIAMAAAGLDNVTDLLIAADTACYAAKERGRNRSQLFIPDDQYFRERKADFLSLSQISEALTSNRLLLYGQRIVPLHAGLSDYIEVLVRMRSTDGSIIPPSRFIPAAERYGMMPLIDRWVIDATMAQLARYRASGQTAPKLNVNLSGLSLADPGIKDYIRASFQGHDVEPGQIGFEITESCAIAQLDLALQFIDFCRDIGCDLALDDFGSGLSSFAYLKRFKVRSLKIDGMFVRNADVDADDRAVIESMVRLAQHKKLYTVAEFVVNDAVLATVRDLGVDYAQGFALHVPEPLDQLLPI
jgi:diguanylate cyclase (GGDEF)-like protein/PAS domain S-box-containing protein